MIAEAPSLKKRIELFFLEEKSQRQQVLVKFKVEVKRENDLSGPLMAKTGVKIPIDGHN